MRCFISRGNHSLLLFIQLQIFVWGLFNTNTISHAFTTKPLRVSLPFVNHNEQHFKSSQFNLSQNKIGNKASSLCLSSTTESETKTESRPSNLEIVLFGVGDLRVSDHEGLNKALISALENSTSSETKILPLFVFSTKDVLPNLPGLPAYTMNLATMMSSALSSLSQELKSQYNLNLEIHTGETMEGVLDQILSDSGEFSEVRMHVCDLGEADSQMGYNPYAHVAKLSLKNNVEIDPWSCQLRNDPLEKIQGSHMNSFPDTFVDYSKLYCATSDYDVLSPISSIDVKGKEELDLQYKLGNSKTDIPTAEMVLSIFETTLDNYLKNSACQKQIEQAKNSGLYGTHWGGINDSICSEADTLKLLNEYTQVCGGDDNLFLSSPFYKEKMFKNNASLEHASISWMGSSSSSQSTNEITGDKLIQGEMIIRYLAAPLLLGCISKRQIYHAGKNIHRETDWPSQIKQAIFGKETSVLEQFIENREWQDLFAAKNVMRQKKINNLKNMPGQLDFKYWRWHGFLCRYAVSDLVTTVSESELSSPPPSSIVLVHGFGASGAQWERAVGELTAQSKVEGADISISQPRFDKAFAPDLIGFGQSDKPPLSYTQYLWESYISTFVREITLQKYKNERFIVGGNSIGGYTAMGCAADDTLTDMEGKVSGSGGPGTGRCNGLVLMNSAGMILTEEDVQKSMDEGKRKGSIAELTSGNRLEPCGAPPRSIAKIGGEALLSYLRPRIKSITIPLYPSNPSNVDDNLCDNILRDSLDPGAINVMISGSKLPPPRTANELLSAKFGAATTSETQTNGNCFEIKEGQWKGPVLVTQGMKDPLNDATGRAKMLGELRDGIEIYPLMEGGHCPHDELPKDVINGIMQWMEKRDNYVNDMIQTDSVLQVESNV